MRTLVAALVLSTASLVGAQVWVAPQDPNGGPPRTAYEQSALTFTTSAVNSPLLLTVW